MRQSFTYKYNPFYFGADTSQTAIMSVPMISYLSGCDMDEMLYYQVFINVNDPNDHTTINQIADAIKAKIPDSEILKAYAAVQSTQKIQGILDKVFYGLISVTMFLSFFSLSASMSANLYE